MSVSVSVSDRDTVQRYTHTEIHVHMYIPKHPLGTAGTGRLRPRALIFSSTESACTANPRDGSSRRFGRPLERRRANVLVNILC